MAGPASSRCAVLGLVGDLFLLDHRACRAQPVHDVYRELRETDLAIANLENALSARDVGGADYPFGPTLVGPPSAVAELTEAGIGLVSLANNHTANHGPDALLETMAILESNGITHAGAGADIERAFAPGLVERRGIRLALVSVYSYFCGFDANEAATASRPGVAAVRTMEVAVPVRERLDTAFIREPPYLLPLDMGVAQFTFGVLADDVRRMEAAIRAARTRADCTMLALHTHWGRHTKQQVLDGKVMLAHRAIEAGADIVIGHGPHVLRGIEVYRGKPILYSLGDFLGRPESGALPVADPASDVGIATRSESLIARVAFEPGAGWNLELIPLVLDDDRSPRPADAQRAESILWRLAGLSAQFDTAIAIRGGRGYLASRTPAGDRACSSEASDHRSA